MIDFEESAIYSNLKEVENDTFNKAVVDFLIKDEEILYSYKAKKDGLVFTNKRIITLNSQGAFGKYKDFTTIAYNKITTFALELNMLELIVDSAGLVTFEFSSLECGKEVYKLLSSFTLA